MQKIKDQALILKLGKLTRQEINPNCCPRVLGAFGNWELRQLSAHYAVGKITKNNAPPLKWQEWTLKLLHCRKYKKNQLIKNDDIEYKKVKCFARVSAAHFDQFLAEFFRGMLFKWKGANKKSHQK